MHLILTVLIAFGLSLPVLYAGESDFSEPAFSDGDPFVPDEEPDCGLYAHWDAAVGRCKVDALPPCPDDRPWEGIGWCEEDPLPSAPSRAAGVAEEAPPVPPPPGVVVLYPGGEREELAECPEGFREVPGDHGWRFCVDRIRPEGIPPLWAPPIAGIPYEKCQAILKRHQDVLMQLPGVTSVGLGRGGIRVHTDQPALVPPEVEGLPIITGPPLVAHDLSHTSYTRVRPLHGGVIIGSPSFEALGYDHGDSDECGGE